MHSVNRKQANALGFGAIVVYCIAIGFIALGVYGFDGGPRVGRSGEAATSQAVQGKMLIATEDRVRCRQYSFDNETQQITPEDLTFCADHWKKPDLTSQASSALRDVFRKQ